MKHNLRVWTALAALLITGLNNSPTVRAEGSKQLTPNNPGTTENLTSATNTRAGYLIHDSNSPNPVSQLFLKPNAPDEQRMYVRMKPGETLYYGLQRTTTGLNINQNNVIITVKWVDEFGLEQSQTTTLVTATGTNPFNAQLSPDQNGVIDDAAQNLAGPKTATNPTGYDALTITYPASQTGTRDYWVEMTQVGEAGLSADGKQSFYDFWDFTVKNASDQEQKGRLFSKFWAFTSGRSTGSAFLNRLSATFNMFTLVPSPAAGQYYVKQVELAGMRPLNFFFVANAKGSGTASTDFTESRKSTTGTGGYAEYLNFVNDPDITLWPSAPVPVFSRTAQFFCNPLNATGSAAFTTTSGENGSVNVLIDLNNNGIQDDIDVLLTQTVQSNVPATLLWNGRDRLNAVVAPGPNVKITLSFTSTGAPVNYPLYDAEGNDDGLRVQNVRPSSGGNTFFDRLYWDDTNLPNSLFPDAAGTPENERVRLNGADSTPGVHRWGDATNDVGNNITMNTWTYGFITPIDQVFTYEFLCDNDNDLVGDPIDLDDDNDGILDLTETFGVDPQLVGPSGVLVYLDAAYIHPILGGYIDLNRDGINDIFDTDNDGIPNHFDLDADGDGIPDAVEANSNVVPTYARGTAANNNRSSYSAAASRYIGAVGANGIPNAAESNNNDSGTLRTALVQNAADDADSDTRTAGSNTARLYNFLDIDSDNDGISDEIEFQTTAAYDIRKAQANFTTDTDRNGLRDAYDPGNGGTAIGTPVNSDGTGAIDMFATDSDGDNAGKSEILVYRQTADWSEGFAIGSDGVSGSEIVAKAAVFATLNPTKSGYYPITNDADGNASVLSLFLQDANANGIPNFLERGNVYYHDDNFNGLVDLYDPTYGGAPSTAPKMGTATEAAFRSFAVEVPLPVTLVDFTALAAGTNALLRWATAQEQDNAGFDIERSADGKAFAKVYFVTGQGTTSQRTSYAYTDKGAGLRPTTWFYRLRQVDRDGTASYSPVRVISFAGTSRPAQLVAYPNPAHNAMRVLVLGNAPTAPLQLFDAVGRLVHSQLAPTDGAEAVMPLTSLPAGIYVLRCGTLSQRITVE
ncbi:T9SS type A sorting domain-containing protein [Hymenobacter sp. IS2118]|uniref:T9SS type A sorting domain-containing protein n=1 Tax=Hymenobacter sp. IS2118 TaxID=1505605 RepID=UPI000690D3A2|nr:T9SS type A sorting domain-containing protein [Hymenobacter sp. IS2118]